MVTVKGGRKATASTSSAMGKAAWPESGAKTSTVPPTLAKPWASPRGLHQLGEGVMSRAEQSVPEAQVGNRNNMPVAGWRKLIWHLNYTFKLVILLKCCYKCTCLCKGYELSRTGSPWALLDFSVSSESHWSAWTPVPYTLLVHIKWMFPSEAAFHPCCWAFIWSSSDYDLWSRCGKAPAWYIFHAAGCEW